MQVLSNSGKLAMVLGTRTILLHSNHRFPPSLTHFNSFPLPSLQSQPNTTASSGMFGDRYFPMPRHSINTIMSKICFSKKAGTTSNGILTGRHRAAIATADVCDSNAELLANGDLRALDPLFKMYGQCLAFSGSIVTVKVFEDNVLVRQLLESKGNGRVLVIDGGGSTRCALVGGNLAQTARDMGWAGIVVNGCIRDVNEINGCDIGVRALGSNPLKSNKKAVGEKHVPVRIAGTLIHDEEWLYADSDGILISKIKLSV
ncbi:putative 4-hydroxy-4-methyl-2-oxoglutarate aldolase 3 isoform X1 [Hibiscus syriacus]|uniref:putative 4-hydroxy-4-methyl-2-oxoglutarate aldolase 3 isoform X1 n=1 Tax=Hibiscus syriacus TaxID=106335 RepID=UPI001922075B|nr:putative 4-hydroxy-4-methyl-2-oxoglutarate aldolase 3 isoform X1 [Hibiscus syriacus]